MDINDHGFFWWASEGHEKRVAAGLLTIDSSGLIQLELHQTLPDRSGAGGIFGEKLPEEMIIAGRLKSNGHYALLTGLTASGGRSGMISYEIFEARECLISHKLPNIKNFSKLFISLDGLQQWMRPGSIDYAGPPDCNEADNNKIAVNFELNPKDRWELDSGSIEILHDFTGHKPEGWAHSASIGMDSSIIYKPNSAATSGELLEWFRSIQDLLLILTNSNLTLKWPRLLWEDGENIIGANFYFRRNNPSSYKVIWHETLLPYSRIKSSFGSMLETWISNRKNFGPGISLYLGTRRNKPLYAEHRFVNLVWGLEALDRRVDSSKCDEPKLKEKIERLKKFVESAEGINRSDRKWLGGLLESRGTERPLSDRLRDILKPVAIGIDEEKLEEFTKTCANLRNDLSHHGGERETGDYKRFIGEIINRSDALSKLYLLLIISLLGVESDEIKRIIYHDPSSNSFRVSFMNAGLIPEPDLDELFSRFKHHGLAPDPSDEEELTA